MGRPIIAQSRYQTENAADSDYAVAEIATDQNDRTVFLVSDISEQTSAIVISKLISFARQGNKPIRFIINTYGGSVDESLAIYDTMKIIQAPIHTVGIGKVMSAGVLLLAAGEKGHRIVGSRARIMIHNGHSWASGDPWEFANEMQEFTRLMKLEEECLIAESKLTRKQLNVILKNRVDHYITAADAVKYGIADKVT